DEGPERAERKDDREQPVSPAPPQREAGDHGFVGGGAEEDDPNDDADRRDRTVVEAEHDNGRQQPDDPGDQEQPPEVGGLLAHLAPTRSTCPPCRRRRHVPLPPYLRSTVPDSGALK